MLAEAMQWPEAVAVVAVAILAGFSIWTWNR